MAAATAAASLGLGKRRDPCGGRGAEVGPRCCDGEAAAASTPSAEQKRRRAADTWAGATELSTRAKRGKRAREGTAVGPGTLGAGLRQDREREAGGHPALSAWAFVLGGAGAVSVPWPWRPAANPSPPPPRSPLPVPAVGARRGTAAESGLRAKCEDAGGCGAAAAAAPCCRGGRGRDMAAAAARAEADCSSLGLGHVGDAAGARAGGAPTVGGRECEAGAAPRRATTNGEGTRGQPAATRKEVTTRAWPAGVEERQRGEETKCAALVAVL